MDECHNAGTCDPATGLCDNPAKPDDAPCKNASTGNAGTCQVGICVSNKDAPEPCQVDSECPTLFECIEGKCQPVTKGPLDSIPGCGCSHVGDNGTSSQTSPFALLALGVFFARKRCAKNRRVELYIGNAEGGEETKP
jgi:MYXO-CTERM domain-containing protein